MIKAWLLSNGKETKIMKSQKEIMDFLGICKNSVYKHYENGLPIKGWTIDRTEINRND